MESGSIDIWKSLVGVALFMLGMGFLESAVKKLTGRRFKLFLKKQTSNNLKAIFGGAALTGLLQSSSIVNLITLAFVGAGVIGMSSALAIMLGSNLGTTLSSWLVAYLGFGAGIDSFAYPLTGLAGIASFLFDKERKAYQWCSILLGVGLLFVGLGYIKTGIESLIISFNFSAFNSYPVIIFLLIGVVITSLIQSSSATVAIVLSALYADAITLYTATAITLGAEIGTTLKLILASVGGSAVKKRVALGNILFNVITAVPVIIFLSSINTFITDVLHVENKLFALVTFQSLVNVISILLFFPLLNTFSRFLEHRFINEENETLFINKTGIQDVDIAIAALKNETAYYLYQVTGYCIDTLGIANQQWQKDPLLPFIKKNNTDKYDHIKAIYGDVHAYYMSLQGKTTSETSLQELEKLMFAVRNAMYGAKNMKDIQHDIEHLSNSSNDVKYDFFIAAKGKADSFYSHYILILDNPASANFESLSQLYNSVQENYTQTLKTLYEETITHKISDTEISTILNFNRELYSSFKALVMALKDYILNEEQAAYFDGLPGFIR